MRVMVMCLLLMGACEDGVTVSQAPPSASDAGGDLADLATLADLAAPDLAQKVPCSVTVRCLGTCGDSIDPTACGVRCLSGADSLAATFDECLRSYCGVPYHETAAADICRLEQNLKAGAHICWCYLMECRGKPSGECP